MNEQKLSFLERFMLREMWRRYNNYPNNNELWWIAYGRNEKTSIEYLFELGFCEMGNLFGCRITERGVEKAKEYLFSA